MNSRRVTWAVAALVVAVLLWPAALPRPALARSQQWAALAAQALTEWELIEGLSVQQPAALANALQATVWLSSWDDPRVQPLLNRIFALRNPDGGWGVNAAVDAHGDGTVNPAETSYLVTMAGHVGPVLLDGYRNGKVDRQVIEDLLALIAAAPRIDTTDGRCLAYSMHPNDAKPGLCVHNSSAGAALFMLQAGDAGFPVMWWLVQGIAQRTAAAYNATTRFWPYRDNTAPAAQDVDHNSYTAEAAYELEFPIGWTSAYKMMTHSYPAEPQSPVAHMRLTALPDSDARIGYLSWCELGDLWLAEAQTYIAAQVVAANSSRLAQAAYYTARAAHACV